MQKSLKKISELKFIDLIIEVHDARSINATSNSQIFELFKNRQIKIAKIALKKDLADLNTINSSMPMYDSNEKNITDKLIKVINDNLNEKKLSYAKKGLVNPMFYVLIIGLPNVGKSTIINRMKKNNVVVSQNRPGVTINTNLIKINNNIFLYDTPGIMVKKINDDYIGYILVLLNIINHHVVNLHDVLFWWFDYVKKHYLNDLKKSFDFYDENFDNFMNNLINKYKVNGLDNAYLFLYNKIISGQLFKINYDQK